MSEKIKKTFEKFRFIEECEFFKFLEDDKDYEEYIYYHFINEKEDDLMEAYLAVPVDENYNLYWYFAESKRDGIFWVRNKKHSVLKTTPNWFQELFENTKKEVEIRDKIRKIFIQKKDA